MENEEKEVLELGEIPETVEKQEAVDDKDYKALYEDERNRVENISKTYKQEEANKNKLLHALARLKGALEVNGIAEIDDEFNITLKQRQEANKEEATDIDEQIKILKQKNRDGEIDIDDYTEKLADLVSEKKMKEYEKKVLELQQREKEEKSQQATIETKQAEQQKVWDYLEANYPDHNVPGSRIQQEMAKVIQDNQHVYSGIDLTKPENIRWRLKLAEEAYNSLVKQGLAKSKATSNASIKNFKTIDNTGGGKEQGNGMNEQQKLVVGNFLNDPKLAKQINKMAQTLNSNGALLLEG